MIEATWYFVSEDPDRLVKPLADQDRDVDHGMPHYKTREDAVDAIRGDHHGETGTLYVIKADIQVVATATRNWSIVRKHKSDDIPFEG